MDDILTLIAQNEPGNDQNDRLKSANSLVYFIRPELMKILNIYGRMVALGEWHDYAIDHGKAEAVFSIFRRASEMPMYKITKEPALANQQGMWRISGMDQRIVKRGHDLNQLLRFFDRHLVKAVR
jgi:hypothetical protein